MTGTDVARFTHKQSRSYLNQLVFSKNTQIPNFINSINWEPSCSMRAGGGTDRLTNITKVIVVFRKFANVFFPKIVSYMI